MRQQKTLSKNVTISGVGLFTGAQIFMSIKPADVDTGIVFMRLDIPDTPIIKACLESVKSTPRCTILGNADFSVSTVEHLMAAFAALGITNACVELNGPEVPILDGSSEIFIDLMLKAGIKVQKASIEPIQLSSAVYFSSGNCHIVAIPSDKFTVSYTLQFPENYKIPTQFLCLDINQETFMNQLSSARTFSSYEEIAPLLEKGGVLGGSLSSALVYKEGVVMNPDGLRYKDECVRHKILDLIGDLALMERPLNAHILAIRSGHAANVSLARLICEQITMECV